MSKWLHLELMQAFEQTRLSKHSYKNFSAANDCDFQMWKRCISPYYERDIYVDKYPIYNTKSEESR